MRTVVRLSLKDFQKLEHPLLKRRDKGPSISGNSRLRLKEPLELDEHLSQQGRRYPVRRFRSSEYLIVRRKT